MGKAAGEKPSRDTFVPKNSVDKDVVVLDKINKDNEFKIVKKGSKFSIQHVSLQEPISLSIATLEQAVEFRNFLHIKRISDQSCVELEELSKCILVNPENNPYTRWLGMTNDVFRSWDGAIARVLKTPVFAVELLPPSIKWKNENVSLLKDYMNDIMKASQINANPVIMASK